MDYTLVFKRKKVLMSELGVEGPSSEGKEEQSGLSAGQPLYQGKGTCVLPQSFRTAVCVVNDVRVVTHRGCPLGQSHHMKSGRVGYTGGCLCEPVGWGRKG